MRITIVIPAAGASARMGGADKLLERIDGEALLTRTVRRAVATGWPVVVALDAERSGRIAALGGLAVTQVAVARPEDGMGASIRDAMAAVSNEAEAVMILPADMPDLTPGDLEAVATACAGQPTAVWRGASAEGMAGHPVVFPARLFDKLRNLPNEDGARAALIGEDVRICPLPCNHALTDLDRPEDWDRWRRAHSQT